MPGIVLKNVTKIYKNSLWGRRNYRSRREVAIAGANLTIAQGEFVFVVGSRGAGKSTLLQLISGDIKPSSGAVYLDGDNVRNVRLWDRGRMTDTFGRVYQRPTLVRKRTVEENLESVTALRYRFRPGAYDHIGQRIDKVLGLVGVSGVNDRFPVELSSGEVRRVELARALINSPSILVLDELTNSLDDDGIWDIFQLLKELNEKGTTVIMATHASRYVNIMHRRVITLVDGHIYRDVQHGQYGNVI